VALNVKRLGGGEESFVVLLSAVLIFVPPLLISRCSRNTTTSGPGVTGVWAVDEGEKVKKDDLEHWAKADPRNKVWDGERISLFGGRNEIIGFQLIVEAHGSGAHDVVVRLDSIRSDEYTIKNREGSTDPFDFVGKRIELFAETYLNVTGRKHWNIPSARPLPDRLHTGWIPDPLIPLDRPDSLHNTPHAAPFDIAAGNNQGVWVDVYIPREAPAGQYGGTLQVLQGDSISHSIPLSLRVFDFTLPDTTHLRNHIYFAHPVLTKRHGVQRGTSEYWDMFRIYENYFHRHRLDLTEGNVPLDSFKVNLAGYYTGGYYTARYGYDGPGASVGNQTYSIGTFDQPSSGWRSGFYPDNRSAWQAAADAWEGWFRQNASTVMRFKYMLDEPRYYQYPLVKEKASWIKSSPGPGKDLGILVTTRMAPTLYGYITHWMLTGNAGGVDSGGTVGFDVPVARARKAAGEKVGIYNGDRPSAGDPGALDDFATDARVNPWICWKYDVDLYFYWNIAFYAELDRNPWEEIVPGTLVYSGEDKLFPGEDRGFRGPLASLRLKNLRRGVQDYEYLWLARQAGVGMDAIVNAVVPAAFNDYNGNTFTCQSDQPIWANKGYLYEEARRQLAELLEAAHAGEKSVSR
jgi:hypothetical protein